MFVVIHVSFQLGCFQMVDLARQNWMGLLRVLPQLLNATGRVDEAEGLLRQVPLSSPSPPSPSLIGSLAQLAHIIQII